MNRFSDRRIWPLKAHGLWIFAVKRADSRISRTLRIRAGAYMYARPFFRPAAADLGSAVNFDVDTRLCLFDVQILDPKPVNEI